MGRMISAGGFLSVYLVFLAWYDGWGGSALAEAEIDALFAGATEHEALEETLQNLRQMALQADDGEFFMLNLNRYQYAPEQVQQGVPEDYQAYSAAVAPLLLRRAGHPVFSASFNGSGIANQIGRREWDAVILVRYRSMRDFLEMVTSEEYLDIVEVRAGGIAYAEVSPTSAGLSLATPRSWVLLILAALALLIDWQFFRPGPGSQLRSARAAR